MNPFSGLSRFNDLGLLILRLGVAVIFIAHGSFKWGLWGMAPSDQMPAFLLNTLKALSILEPLAALALLAGVLVPLTGICISVLMLLIINMKVNTMGVGFVSQTGTGWELDFMVLCGALCLVFTGPGKWSLQGKLDRNK